MILSENLDFNNIDNLISDNNDKKKELSDERKFFRAHKGKSRILIIDDDEIVRTLLSRMLEREGFFSVIACADGLEGISVFKEEKDIVDMVLLDMIMPGLNGAETFFELKKIDSSVKTLILSGYTRDDSVQQIMDNGGCGFIQKPVTHARLFKEIDKILNKTE